MDTEEALEVISNLIYSASKELRDGLPGGSDEEWNYDDALVIEIAGACIKWQSRQSQSEDPYVVWFFRGESWSKGTDEM